MLTYCQSSPDHDALSRFASTLNEAFPRSRGEMPGYAKAALYAYARALRSGSAEQNPDAWRAFINAVGLAVAHADASQRSTWDLVGLVAENADLLGDSR